jgi:hypothetical protein
VPVPPTSCFVLPCAVCLTIHRITMPYPIIRNVYSNVPIPETSVMNRYGGWSYRDLLLDAWMHPCFFMCTVVSFIANHPFPISFSPLPPRHPSINCSFTINVHVLLECACSYQNISMAKPLLRSVNINHTNQHLSKQLSNDP